MFKNEIALDARRSLHFFHPLKHGDCLPAQRKKPRFGGSTMKL